MVLGLGAAAGPAAAQAPQAVRLTVRLAADSTPAGSRAPVVRSENLLGDGRWLSALRSGLPVRLHYRVEVWRSRGGWFDAFERQAEWDVVLRHEPLLDQYTAAHARRRPRPGAALRHARRPERGARLCLPGERAARREPGATTTRRRWRSRRCRIPTSTSCSGFWKAIWARWRRARRAWATRWAAARPASCSDWRDCRACGSRCGAHAFEVR